MVQRGEWWCAAASDGCNVVVSGGGSGGEWRCSVEAGTVQGTALVRKEKEGGKGKNDLKIGRSTLSYECARSR